MTCRSHVQRSWWTFQTLWTHMIVRCKRSLVPTSSQYRNIILKSRVFTTNSQTGSGAYFSKLAMMSCAPNTYHECGPGVIEIASAMQFAMAKTSYTELVFLGLVECQPAPLPPIDHIDVRDCTRRGDISISQPT